jgi:hypothetical protein
MRNNFAGDAALKFMYEKYLEDREKTGKKVSFHKWLKVRGILSPDAEQMIRQNEVPMSEDGFEDGENA